MTLTLLSDFGYRDNFVGIVKGILYRQLPGLQVIDVSHEVMSFHILQCSYYLKSAFHHFPAGTFHLSLFDIMHKTPATLLIAEIESQYVLSSDNGLLPLTFAQQLGKVYQGNFEVSTYLEWIENTAIFLKDWKNRDFSTGHLQEIQACSGPYSLGPFQNEDSLECQVIHVDKYGNVVINITKDEFEHHRNGRKFSIYFSRTEVISKISADYSNVPEGEKLCRFNSGNFLELAINKGSAAQLFGLSVIRDHQLIYQKVKINFF